MTNNYISFLIIFLSNISNNMVPMQRQPINKVLSIYKQIKKYQDFSLYHRIKFAYENNNWNQVKFLLKPIENIQKFKNGSLIDYACSHENAKLIEYFTKDNDVILNSSQVKKGALIACAKENLSSLEFWLKYTPYTEKNLWQMHKEKSSISAVTDIKGQVPHYLDGFYREPLLIILFNFACYKASYDEDYLAVVKFLVEKKGAPVDLGCFWQIKLLNKNLKVTYYLIQSGANPNTIGNYEDYRSVGTLDESILMKICARTDGLDLVKLLVEKGADINYELKPKKDKYCYESKYRSKYGEIITWSPLSEAIFSNNKEIVDFLISKNVKVNPCHIVLAVYKKDKKYWLDKFRDYINILDDNGNTVLHYFAQNSISSYYYSYHNLNAKNDYDNEDHGKKYSKRVCWLLVYGANPEIKNKYGQTAYDQAKDQKIKDLLKNQLSIQRAISSISDKK